MIERSEIGRTPYGGEIVYLKSDKPYEIAALRIFVSIHRVIKDIIKKPIKTIEDFISYINRHPDVCKPYVRRILTFHHGDIGEMDNYGFYFKSVSRLFTFISWIPIGANRGIKGVGTELSLRYVEHGGFIHHKNEALRRLEQNAESLYRELRDRKVAKEDARYVLPLSTKTEEIIQVQLGRDLAKWANYLAKEPFSEVKAIGEHLVKWNEKENGFSLPSVELPNSRMPLYKRDEDAQRTILRDFLKDKPNEIYYDPRVQALVWHTRRSIASFHQDVRNRQVYFWWPSWEAAIGGTDVYIPPWTPKEETKRIRDCHEHSIETSRDFFEKGDYEMAVYSLTLGRILDLFCAIYGNSNIYETVRLRACMRAQKEIRDQYRLIARSIAEKFPYRLGARCETEGVCFEPQRELCPLYKRYVIGGKK